MGRICGRGKADGEGKRRGGDNGGAGAGGGNRNGTRGKASHDSWMRMGTRMVSVNLNRIKMRRIMKMRRDIEIKGGDGDGDDDEDEVGHEGVDEHAGEDETEVRVRRRSFFSSRPPEVDQISQHFVLTSP